MENLIEFIGNRNRDLPDCSALAQLGAQPRTPEMSEEQVEHGRENTKYKYIV
jgi:hypothetical protein